MGGRQRGGGGVVQRLGEGGGGLGLLLLVFLGTGEMIEERITSKAPGEMDLRFLHLSWYSILSILRLL